MWKVVHLFASIEDEAAIVDSELESLFSDVESCSSICSSYYFYKHFKTMLKKWC